MTREQSAEAGRVNLQKLKKEEKKKIPGGISERDREVIRGYVSFMDSLQRGHIPKRIRRFNRR